MTPKPYSLQTTVWARYFNALKKYFQLPETNCLISRFLLQYINRFIGLVYLTLRDIYYGCISNCRFCFEAVVGEDTDHGCLPWLVSSQASDNLKCTLYYCFNSMKINSAYPSGSLFFQNLFND
jgi:hypothetical protein